MAPDDDVEIRQVTLTNDSDTPRTLQLTTYGEVVLAPPAADQRHPAFTKLFVESEPLPTGNGLLFRRRPRAAHDQAYCLVHMLVVPPQESIDGITWESDRARFLGRHRTLRNPLALETPLSNTTGATLDAVMALRTVLTLPAQSRVSLAVLTLAADSRSAALQLAQRYQSWTAIERVFGRARSSAEQELHQLGLHGNALEHIQGVLSALLYPHPALRPTAATLAANRKGQEGLWAYGISGDYPILLVCVDDESAGDLLQSVLQAHMYWRRRGVQVDLLLLNQQETGYGQEMQEFIFRLLRRMESEEWLQPARWHFRAAPRSTAGGRSPLITERRTGRAVRRPWLPGGATGGFSAGFHTAAAVSSHHEGTRRQTCHRRWRDHRIYCLTTAMVALAPMDGSMWCIVRPRRPGAMSLQTRRRALSSLTAGAAIPGWVIVGRTG